MAGKQECKVCQCGHEDNAHRSRQIGDLTYCRLCSCNHYEVYDATLTIEPPRPKAGGRRMPEPTMTREEFSSKWIANLAAPRNYVIEEFRADLDALLADERRKAIAKWYAEGCGRDTGDTE